MTTDMHNEKQKKRKAFLPYLLGIGFLLLYVMPYFLLGKDASFRISDFLDDEIIQYKLSGKYFFSGFDVKVLEWMGGIEKSAIQPPCFILIWPFRFLSFYGAVMVSFLLDMFFAYTGTFLLIDKIGKHKNGLIPMITAVVFCMLPFYPSYGLSSIGIPLLIWAIWEIYDNKNLVWAYISVGIFALFSSLVWSGYFLVGFTALAAIGCWLKKNKKTAARIACAVAEMSVLYIYVFKDTLYSMFFTDIVSHRNDPDRVFASKSMTETFYEYFKYGQYHAPSYHTYIMAGSFALSVGMFIWMLFDKKKRVCKNRCLDIMGLWILAFLIAGFAGFYNSDAGYAFRSHLGFLKSIQFDRIYWLYPTIWYIIFALCLYVVFELLAEYFKDDRIRVFLQHCVAIFAFVFWALYLIGHNAEYSDNLRVLKGQEREIVSYRQYYDEEMFAEVKTYLGKDVEAYRVVSLGIAPAIASANDFYTLDAYSTNYDLAYKKKFRTVMEKELAKNEAIRSYFDNWGNRCYLFSAELGMDWNIMSDDRVVHQLELDTKALKELGADYLFSTVEIENATDNNLSLLRIFHSDYSNRILYVYEVKKQDQSLLTSTQ